MTNLLIKLFVKDSKNTSDPAVRKRYGYLGAFTGIVLNILLFLGKLIAGILSGGISVIADAFNNLSDAGSSIMTFVGFKMAGMPADSEHPYGHGRMEYVSGIIISFIIMMMGFELGKSSVEKIFSPEKSEFSILAVSVLGASLLVKLVDGTVQYKARSKNRQRHNEGRSGRFAVRLHFYIGSNHLYVHTAVQRL